MKKEKLNDYQRIIGDILKATSYTKRVAVEVSHHKDRLTSMFCFVVSHFADNILLYFIFTLSSFFLTPP